MEKTKIQFKLKKFSDRLFFKKLDFFACVIFVFFSISSVSAFDSVGVSPLMQAVANNDIEGVKFFIKIAPNSINQKNIGSAAAIHIAARNGNSEIVKILLNNYADVNLKDNDGWTALMRAAFNGDVEIVDLLLRGNANPYYLNSAGEGAIIHSTFSDCNKCLTLILGKINFANVDLDLFRNQVGQAFVIAQRRDNEEGKKILQEYLDQMAISKNFEIIQNSQNNNQQNNQDSDKNNDTPKYILKSEENEEKLTEVLEGESSEKNLKLEEKVKESPSIEEGSEPISIQNLNEISAPTINNSNKRKIYILKKPEEDLSQNKKSKFKLKKEVNYKLKKGEDSKNPVENNILENTSQTSQDQKIEKTFIIN